MIKEMYEKLDKGLKRLVSFETSTMGYEWFGKAPGHEALTAMGCNQFRAFEEAGLKVDQEMMTRTCDTWLLSRAKDDGTFELNKRALDSFGRASKEITVAYILWTMTSSNKFNPNKVPKQISKLKEMAAKSQDPYVLGLAAGTFYNIKENGLATRYAD